MNFPYSKKLLIIDRKNNDCNKNILNIQTNKQTNEISTLFIKPKYLKYIKNLFWKRSENILNIQTNEISTLFIKSKYLKYIKNVFWKRSENICINNYKDQFGVVIKYNILLLKIIDNKIIKKVFLIKYKNKY